MTPRQVVQRALAHQPVPYTPWSFGFTVEAAQALRAHYGTEDLDGAVGNHILDLGQDIGIFEDLGEHRHRDLFGTVWDRTVDRDIGNVERPALQGPTLQGYAFPDPHDARFFADIPSQLACRGDCFRLYCVGFSLFERAWTMRGMEALMLDFHDHPHFVRDLLRAISDFNLAEVEKALSFDVDAVYFGDDWGQQHGLLMGYPLWREFIYPELQRAYSLVREHGRHVFIHSCGDVDELLDDLLGIGLTCFNPFQPEVMDVHALHARYRGRLAFWGGLSTQRTLPFGSTAQVRTETRRLLEMGRGGGYILAPAHAVEGDVPLANMLAFIDEVQAQPGYPGPQSTARQTERNGR